MGLTGILILLDLALLALAVYIAARGIRAKSRKKSALPICAFCALTALVYFGALALITSM